MSSINNNNTSSSYTNYIQQALTTSNQADAQQDLKLAQQVSGLNNQDFQTAVDNFMQSNGASASQIAKENSLLPGAGQEPAGKSNFGGHSGGTAGAAGTSQPTTTST